MRLIIAALFSAILVCSIWPLTANAQEVYADQCACTGVFVGRVMHSPDFEEAKTLALRACSRFTDNCSTKPATATVGQSQMFVTTCCLDNNDSLRCHTVPTAHDEDLGRNEAFNTSRQAFYDAGLPNDRCRRVATYSVRTGKRLRD